MGKRAKKNYRRKEGEEIYGKKELGSGEETTKKQVEKTKRKSKKEKKSTRQNIEMPKLYALLDTELISRPCLSPNARRILTKAGMCL